MTDSTPMQVHDIRELIECAYRRSAEIGWENADGVLLNDMAGLAEALLDDRIRSMKSCTTERSRRDVLNHGRNEV